MDNIDDIKLDNAILFCEDSSGQYIPMRFANEIDRSRVQGVTSNDWENLEKGPEFGLGSIGDGTDSEVYWSVWNDVLANSIVLGHDGTRYYLFHDGDLWLVPTEDC